MKSAIKVSRSGKPYIRPHLVRYGSIRALTKAGSGGRSEGLDTTNPLKYS